MEDNIFKILCECMNEFPEICFNPALIPLKLSKTTSSKCNNTNEIYYRRLFVLYKYLTIMAYMRKLRTERHRLKIENGRFKAVLKNLGININDLLLDDRLIICCCRKNNNRLEEIDGELEKQIKDLGDKLEECNSCQNPCKAIQIIKEQLRKIMEDVEKLRDIGEDQRVEFTEAEKKSPCAGVNRLKAEIRELRKNEKAVVDQNHPVTIAQRPIETGTTLSKTDDNSGIEEEAVHHPLIATKSSKEFTQELVAEGRKILKSSELIIEDSQEHLIATEHEKKKENIETISLTNCLEELAKLQSDNSELKNDLQKLRERNAVYEKKLLSLSRQTDDRQGVELGKELIGSQQTMSQLSEKDLPSEQLQHQGTEQENIKLRQQLEELQKRVFELDAENLQLKNDPKNLRENNGNVEGKLNLLEALNGEEDNFKFKFEKCLEEVNKLKVEKLKLTNDLEDFQKLTGIEKNDKSPEVTSGDEEISQLRLDLENCQKEVHQLKSENSNLKDSLQNSMQQKESSERTDVFLEKESTTYGEMEHVLADDGVIPENRILHEEIDEWKEKYHKLNEKLETENENNLEALKDFEAKYKNLEDELVTRKSESSTLETENNKLLEEWEKEKSTNDNLKEYSTTLGEQLQTLKEHEESLQNKLEQTRKSLESTTINEETLKEKLEEVMSGNNNLEESLIQQEKELNSVKDDIGKITLVNKKLEERLKQALTEKDLLQKDCDQIKESSENKSLECVNLKKENNELKSKINKLQTDLQDSSDKIKELSGKLDEKIKKVNGLTQDITNAKDQVKLMESKYSDCENLKKQSENDLDLAKKEEESMRNQLSAEKEAKETIQKELLILKKDLKDLIFELNNMKINNERLNKERDNLTKQLMSKEYEMDKLSLELKTELNKVETLKNELLNYQNIGNTLEDVEKKLTDVTHDKNDTIMKMNELQEELNLLKMELTKCRDQNEELQKELVDSKKQQSILRRNSNDLEDEISALKNARKQLENDYDESLNKSADFKDNLQTLMNENMTLKKEIDNLKTVNTNVQADLDASQILNEQLQQKLENLERERSNSKTKINALRKDLQTSRASFSKEKTQVNSLESSLADLRLEKTSLVEELNRLRIEIETLEANLVSKENQLIAAKIDLVEFNALKDELNKCREQRDELVTKSDTMKKQMETLKEGGRRVSDELDSMKPKLSVLKTEKEELNSQIKTLEMELEDLKIESEKKKALEKVKEELEKRLKDSETVCNKLKQEIENLKQSSNAAKEKGAMKDMEQGELDALKETLASLRQTIEIRDIENDELKTELEETKREIDKLKLESNEIKNKNRDAQVKNLNNETTRLDNEVNQLDSLKGQLEKNIGKKSSEVEQMQERLKSVSLERDSSEVEKMQLDQDKLSHELEKKESQMSDVPKGANKWMDEKEQFGMENNRLKRELDELKKNSIDMKMNMEDDMKIAEVSEDSSNPRQDLQRVKRENDELKINWRKSKRDFDKCEQENEKLKSELRRIMKSVSETKDGIQRAPVVPSGNENDEPKELLQSKDSELLKMEIERLQAKNNMLENSLNDLKNVLINYKTENDILKSDVDETSKLNEILSQMESFRMRVQDLEGENKQLIDARRELEKKLNMQNTDIQGISSLRGSLHKDVKLTKKLQPDDLKKCKEEIKRLQNELDTVKFEHKILKTDKDDSSKMHEILNEVNKWKKKSDRLEEENKLFRSRINSVEDVAIIDRLSNDLIKAIDFLSLQMKRQTEGINRIRENMGHLKNTAWHSFLEPWRSDEGTVFNSQNPLLKNILQQSKNLSTSLTSTEKELVDLGKVWKSCWEENQKLKKLAEDLGAANVLDTTKLPGENIEGVFDPKSWLESLTFTELADLHDQICCITSSFVTEDDGPDTLQDLQQNYNMLNKRIAALQRQIAEKRTDTGTKMIKLRRKLQKTQTEFMKISSLMNQEGCHNSELYRIMKESPCRVNKCKAKCAEYIEFIPEVIDCKRK